MGPFYISMTSTIHFFRVPGDLDSDPDENIVGSKKLKKSILDSKECFILDAGALIILWFGKNASHTMRKAATEYLTVLNF